MRYPSRPRQPMLPVSRLEGSGMLFRVYVCTISPPCAHLLGWLRGSTDGRRDSMMIQADDGSKHLMTFRADVPPMAVRDLHDQPSYVQALEHPTNRVALTAAFA